MDTSTLENLMLEEWKSTVLDGALRIASHPCFDLIYDLRVVLYDFFHPLGISGHGIHDVVRVAGDFIYATEDDGDLSIVVVHTALSKDFENGIDALLRKYGGDPVEHLTLSDSFVVHGHPDDVTHKSVESHIQRHSPDRRVMKFVAKSFGHRALGALHTLLSQFELEQKLGRSEDIDGYFTVRQQNKAAIVRLVGAL